MSDVAIIKTEAGFLLQGNVNFENAVLLRDAGVDIIHEFRTKRNSPLAMGVSQGGESRFSPLSASANSLRAKHLLQEGVRTKCETPVISEKKHCVIDLTQMQNSNAVSLAVLLAWLRVARMQKITLQLIHANVALRSMIEVFGLKQVISL